MAQYQKQSEYLLKIEKKKVTELVGQNNELVYRVKQLVNE